MKLHLLDQVRAGCKTVAERAAHIRINYDLIPSYAEALGNAKTIQPEHDRASHYLDQGDDTAAFFLILDTINFGSGYFPHLHKRPGMTGYFRRNSPCAQITNNEKQSVVRFVRLGY